MKDAVHTTFSGDEPVVYPAISHMQYRLTEHSGVSRLKLAHRAIGRITPDHREGVSKGWSHTLRKVRAGAERRKGTLRGSR